MLESLDINGRLYVASDRAALAVGYQVSYIERLARGKWIDASFVQGQCFVDIASLERFIAASEADVTAQLREAAIRERAEHAWREYEVRTGHLREPARVWFVVGQVGVITMCGCLVAVLSFAALQAEVTWADVGDGLSQTASVLRERVALPAAVIEWLGTVR
jgi:hypothetical protein